jgi:hypothetical protein
MTTLPSPPPSQPADNSRPGEEQRPAAFLSWWVLLAAAPFGAIQVLLAGSRADGTIMSGSALGTALWGLVAAAILAWVLWRVTGRKRIVASVVFLAAYLFLTLGVVSSSFGLPGRAQAAVVRSANATFRAAQMKAKSASDKWVAAGAFDLKHVASRADLRRRVELLDALVAALRGTHEAASAAEAQLRGDLASAGATSLQQDSQVAEWAAGLKLQGERQAAEESEKVLTAGRQQFVLLQEQWGRWEYDPSAERVRFDDPAAAARFQRQAADFAAAHAKLVETPRRLKASAAAE